jgi:hypothetical protein
MNKHSRLPAGLSKPYQHVKMFGGALSHLWIALLPPSSRHFASTWLFKLGTRFGTPLAIGLLPCLQSNVTLCKAPGHM